MLGIEESRLRFAKSSEIEFVDRNRAIRQLEALAKEGAYPVYVVYGPEGCGNCAP